MDPVENGDNAAAGVGVMMMMQITVLMIEIQCGSKKKTVGKQREGEDNLALKLRTRFQETKQQSHPFAFIILGRRILIVFPISFFSKS